jgi:UDP-glucose 4-epimerase
MLVRYARRPTDKESTLMTTVAVTGAGGLLGRAVLERLDADRAVDRIIGIDLVEPPMPVAKLDMRIADLRDPLLDRALDGADVVVHLPVQLGPGDGDDLRFVLTVGGTRQLLAAAEKVGISRLVHVSTGAVYGAHPDNPIPIAESQPARANPDFAPGYHRMLAEELVSGWAGEHPSVELVVLRPAAVLGPGQDDVLSRYLESPRLPVVEGCAPPMQFVHADDVASAVQLAATGDLRGTYNVAADGWLECDEVCALLGRRQVRIPEAVAFSLAARLWRWGVSAVPPGAVHFAMHPCVLSTDRLHDAGWAPTRSNREVLREFAATHHAYLALGRVRVRRRDVALAALATVGLTGAAIAARRHRRSPSTEEVR